MSRARIIAASFALVGVVVGIGASSNASTPPSSPTPAEMTAPDISSPPGESTPPAATTAPADVTEPAEMTAPVDAAATESTAASPAPPTIGSLRFIGEHVISNLTMVDGTLVGGLSGIAFNPETGGYVVISDDRSDNNPARFYDATVTFDAAAFESVEITTAHTFLQPDGTPFPNEEQGGSVPDPEAIRIDPNDGSLWWTSEGSQALDLDPVLIHADATGQTLDTFTMPEAFAATPDQEALGIRDNKATEGVTFSADGQSLFGIMEGPLLQDGILPTLEAGTVSRLVQFDLEGNVIAQYAYPLDPLQSQPAGELADLADNGATEILAVSDTRFLVIERSGIPQAEGPWKMFVRLYEVDIAGATDIDDVAGLAADTSYLPASKTLVLNFEDSGIEHIDNLEGITWGPALANGSQTLVLVSDNNFDPTSVTQFFAYEVVPG